MNARRLFHLILALAMGGAAQTVAAPPDPSFQDGIAAFEAGQYSRAAEAFRRAAATQPAPGTLLNLGLAEWRRGQAGEAVLAWEQTLWMDPFNAGARANLRAARQTAEGEAPDLTWYEAVSTCLPANFWSLLSGASLWFAVAMLVLPGVFRWRKAAWQQALAAIGLGVFLLSIPPQIGILTRCHIGIVLKKNAALRLTPTREAEILTSLPAGEPVRLRRSRGRYWFVHTPHVDGWVETNHVGLICPLPRYTQRQN